MNQKLWLTLITCLASCIDKELYLKTQFAAKDPVLEFAHISIFFGPGKSLLILLHRILWRDEYLPSTLSEPWHFCWFWWNIKAWNNDLLLLDKSRLKNNQKAVQLNEGFSFPGKLWIGLSLYSDIFIFGSKELYFNSCFGLKSFEDA